MKIQVNRVPEEGLNLHESIDPALLDMERMDVHLPEPFDVDAAVSLADKELVVRAGIHCTTVMSCGRCLDEFRKEIAVDAIFSYRVAPTDTVDITDDVRQEVILAYPMIPICRSGCKGLCRQCGQNLNAGNCAHSQAQ